MRIHAAGLIVLASLAVGTPAAAQLDYFGQNKIQYRDFDWQVLRGEHVDLYFYPEERDLARMALAYAEESFDYLVQRFGHSPSGRIPLIVYASHADFEQTNILPFIPPEGILGVTEFLKRRVALPFNGNYAEFRHTLRHELVHAFQLSVMTDSYVRHTRRGRPQLPLWWTEGLAEFWSAGEDAQDEMVLRDLTISGRMPTLRQLTYLIGGVVYPLGGAIHRWLAEEFGEWRVQVLYRDLWRYRSFEQALEGVYGVPIEDLQNQLRYHFRRLYYPAVNVRRPLEVSAEVLAELAVKPIAYRLPGDSTLRYLYLSPITGYMNIYAGDWHRPGARRIIVKGERSAQFESFHPMASRLEVREGIAVFSSRYLERDALFFWDLAEERIVGRYQFPELVSLLSPTWAPNGESVVFSGLTESGYSDLYRLWIPDGRLEQLTVDQYEDTDPNFSPDGGAVVFSSDRTAFGPDGALNLYILDLGSANIRPLTYGPWRDEAPRWSENGRIYFSSDREGVFDVYSVDVLGRGRRETHTLTGAFDPQWVASENAMLFGGFNDLSFNIFRAHPSIDSTERVEFALAEDIASNHWTWPALDEASDGSADPVPYRPGLSLDFAAGDALVAPGIGSAQGAVFRFSDLMSDHLLYVAATSFQGENIGGFIDNLNATAFYLNRKRRLNWGIGAFRLRGLFLETDLSTLFEETSFGAYGDVRWPFSRFKRIEGQLRIERSDRFDVVGAGADDPRRVGWLASNFLSYVHDNSLWLPTGPIDGRRTNLTAGITNDLSNGRFDAWMLSLDHRRYHRLSLRTAYAVRAFGYLTGGSRPRRISIGGPWGLRGYPRIGGVAGTRAFLLNQEFRFPITNFLTLGFPFGAVRFPGVQGALFADLGGAWTENSIDRGVLGSAGLGLRMSLGFPVVLRLDFGYRFELGATRGYQLRSNGRKFVDFFFGFNY
ncbi:MAG: hypothetical protein GTN62_08835 [Gemmatimonadales bacterium]|nr:hypothetical protein [Gemmatimonadales bacterium]NIN50201.1 hypothetical protein [Gemmatimonadales bacterium]NIP07665.1 hypothetical protein [Gemmatimonadales bacterium]NIR01817.1 hypothetical protein [Gemmatimonadales bacterium]NIS65720.1 hypothetical protein [Gemmatimonadales bacterium]